MQDVVDFIGARLDQGMSPSQAASALLDACLANDPKEARGVGCDNMTALVVMLKGPGSEQSAAGDAGAPAAGTSAASTAAAAQPPALQEAPAAAAAQT